METKKARKITRQGYRIFGNYSQERKVVFEIQYYIVLG